MKKLSKIILQEAIYLNLKKIITAIIITTVTVTALPINYNGKVKAAVTGYTSYNSNTTEIQNKYGITGTIYDSKKYSDFTAVISGISLYIIKDGAVEKYNIESAISDYTTSYSILKRLGNKLFIYQYNSKNPVLITFDLDKKYIEKVDAVANYFPNDGANSKPIRNTVIDNAGVQWYLAQEQIPSMITRVMLTKVNTDKSIKNYDVTQISGQYGIGQITTDNNNNLWMVTTPQKFDVSVGLANIRKESLVKFNDGQITTFHDFPQDSLIYDYKITPSGDVWAIMSLYTGYDYIGKQIVHLNSSGAVIGQYSVDDNMRYIRLDSQGGIWLGDGQHIMKFENNQFVTKYTLPDVRPYFDVLDANNISANSGVGITLINSGQIENINKESLVKDSAYVIKDNLGSIKVLSKSDNVWVNEISNGKISQPKKVPELNDVSLGYARGYNGFIYLYKNNQILKYDGVNVSVYSTLNFQSDEYMGEMEIGGSGEIYIKTTKNIKVIDQNKNITSVNILGGLKIDSTAVKDGSKLVRDKNNNMYFELYYNIGYTYYKGLYKINNLNAIENVTPSVSGLEYKNIFVNENGDFEFVFYKSGYPSSYYYVYYYGPNDTLVKDDRYDGQTGSVSADFQSIDNVQKTSDNKLIITCGSTTIIKYNDRQTMDREYDFGNATIAADERGGVFVGSSSNGLLYFYPSDMKTDINVSGVTNGGVYKEAAPSISVTNGDIKTALLDEKPFVNGTKITAGGNHVLYLEVRDYKGAIVQKVIGFTIDLTPPTIAVYGPSNGDVLDKAQFKVNAIDGNISTVLLNGKSYNSEEITTPGDYSFYVKAVDDLGNASERTVVFYIRTNANFINSIGDEIIKDPSKTEEAASVTQVGGTTNETDNSSTIVKVDEDKALDAILNTKALVGKLKGKVDEKVLEAMSNIIISSTQSSGTNKIIVPITSNLMTKAGESDLGILLKLGEVGINIPDGAVNLSEYSKDGVFNISKQDINEDEAYGMLKVKPVSLTQIGKIFDFGITVNQDGKEPAVIHQFSNGKKVLVTIELTADQIKDTDVSKLSAYYFNETTKQWEEVGGTFDKATNKFTFETSHFSKYTLMEKSGSLPKTGGPIDMNVLIIGGIAMMLVGYLLISKKIKTN